MVQESVKWLYDLCHARYAYYSGELFFKDDFHSKQRKGRRVGNLNNSGYLKVCLLKKNYLVHRLIFLMHYGYLPDLVEHRDRNKTNNLVGNLRDGDKELNSWNRGLQKNNTSGFRGVSWSKASNKWHAYIKIKGKRFHLGLFETPEEASSAYVQARFDTRGDEESS